MPHQNHTGLWVSGFLKHFLNPSLFQEDSTSGEPGDSKSLLLAKPSRGQRWLHHPSQVKSSHRREGERVVFRVLDQQRGQARPTRQAPVGCFRGSLPAQPTATLIPHISCNLVGSRAATSENCRASMGQNKRHQAGSRPRVQTSY